MKWLPRRFSIRALLVLTLGFCCVLAYRLQPLHQAQKFVAAVKSSEMEKNVAMLPQIDQERVWMCLTKGNSSTWKAAVVDTPWEVLRTGKCCVTIRVQWNKFSTFGSDEVEVIFTTRKQPTVHITEHLHRVAPITII